MTEAQLYHPGGLFQEIVKRSKVMGGRYFVLPNGTNDLNTNSLKGVELPENYFPLVACLVPRSEIAKGVADGEMERLNMRMLWLCTGDATGDHQVKDRDPLTNTSMHKVYQDWADMKREAMDFLASLEVLTAKFRRGYQVGDRSQYRITRITEIEKVKVSGVMIEFVVGLYTDCSTRDVLELSLKDFPTEFPDHAKHNH